MPLPITQRPWDLFFLVYFVTHIPTTLCIDGQAFIPSAYYPQALIDAKDAHIATFGDNLMKYPPLWFQAGILCELVFQLPFFFAASYAFYYGKQWIRTPSIIYAAHVSTTVIMILPELYAQCTSKVHNTKLLLVALYSIYLLIPLALLYRMCRYERPFEVGTASATINKKTR